MATTTPVSNSGPSHIERVPTLTLPDGKVINGGDKVRITNADDNSLQGWFRFIALATNHRTGQKWVDVAGPIRHKGEGKAERFRSFAPDRIKG